MQPGLLLSFNDRAVHQWHASLPIFAKYQAKATFFISELDVLDQSYCRLLRELQEAGHTVGCHGLRHRRARSCVNACGGPHYMCVEVYPSLYAFTRGNLKLPTCWSYPCGCRDAETDKWLLRVFGKLRCSIGTLKPPVPGPGNLLSGRRADLRGDHALDFVHHRRQHPVLRAAGRDPDLRCQAGAAGQSLRPRDWYARRAGTAGVASGDAGLYPGQIRRVRAGLLHL